MSRSCNHLPMARILPIGILSFALLLLLSLTTAADAGNSTSGFHEPILINCGDNGTSTDDNSRSWSGDEGVSSPLRLGLSSTKAASASTQGSVSAIPYMTARISSAPFTYSVQVKADRYFVRLYFYPSDYGVNFPASNAVFDVACGHYTLLKNFSTSYYSQALTLEYFVREYSLNVSSAGGTGWLNITFTPSSNVSSSYAFVNGIELVSMPSIFNISGDMTIAGSSSPYNVDQGTAVETMYRLNVGGNNVPLNQDSGNLFRQWYDDTMYIAGGALGITFVKDNNVSINYPASIPQYIAPVYVYETARSMPWFNDSINLSFNMSWILTVDPGFYYLVRLHFCEIQDTFVRTNQRVFSVYVNNQTAVEDFDVISYSTGLGIPVYHDVITIIPDGDAQVDLWVALHPYVKFKPQYTNVILNGLEVFKLNDQSLNLAGPKPTPLRVVTADANKAMAKGNPNKSSHPAIIGGVAGGIGGLLLIGFLVFFFCCRRGTKLEGTEQDWLPLSMTSSGQTGKTTTGSTLPSNLCRHFTFAEIKAATNNFDEKLLLGVGGFGKVYQGSIDDGTVNVAIKRANPMSEQGIHEFQNEIEMLSKLRHRHLVSLIGYCEENGEMILVYDYMAHGTLREHLYKSKNPPLTWKQRLEICIGAARGLHYLHTGAKYSIIHRDVKTTNILLDENWVAKVSDFGLSKTGPSLDNTHVSTVVKGSFGYLDPEYFRRQQLTDKSDVYSFGVVLFEVLCARPALMRDLPKEQVSLAEWARHCQKKGVLNDIMDPLLKGKIAPQCLKKFAETAEKCLTDVGLDRPAMGDVLWNLEFALQLQESAEAKGVLGVWSNDSNDTGKDLYEPLSDSKIPTSNTGTTASSTSTGIDDRSIASVDSDGLTPSTVFSQIMDPKGR